MMLIKYNQNFPYSGSQHDRSVLFKNTLLLFLIACDSKPMDLKTSLISTKTKKVYGQV